MITDFKIFENFGYKYKVGDCVELFDKKQYMWTIELFVKIIDVENRFESTVPYTFLAIVKENHKIIEICKMEEYVIKRKLTDKESIELEDRFLILPDVNKYNL